LAEQAQSNPLQGYFEWQVTTLLLAYDLAEPIERGDDDTAQQRRSQVEGEVSELTLNQLPQRYRDNPELDWPRDVMMAITRATLNRAVAIAGLTGATESSG
jgi:hypothetical protein